MTPFIVLYIVPLIIALTISTTFLITKKVAQLKGYLPLIETVGTEKTTIEEYLFYLVVPFVPVFGLLLFGIQIGAIVSWLWFLISEKK